MLTDSPLDQMVSLHHYYTKGYVGFSICIAFGGIFVGFQGRKTRFLTVNRRYLVISRVRYN